VANSIGEPPDAASTEGGDLWSAPIWLVLCHPPQTELPRGTARWLDAAPVQAHIHVRNALDDRAEADVARLGRHLTGRAVGLALGGGGARGFAHAGVVRALSEAGVPVDFIAGTSSGAMLGGLLAQDLPADIVAERIVQGVSGRGAPFGDYTAPVVALLRGHRIRDGINRTFGEVQIEDLWLPLTVVATDLTAARRHLFERGSLAQAVLASSSPPGATPPVPIEGRLYCDGGLVDNLPLDVVEARGCHVLLACAVGSEAELHLPGDAFPPPWSMAWDRVARGGRTTRGVPSIMDILVRATTLPSSRDLPAIRERCDIFFAPPVDDFEMLDFSNPGPVVARAYAYARSLLCTEPAAKAVVHALNPTSETAC
jgi:NTE family protein